MYLVCCEGIGGNLSRDMVVFHSLLSGLVEEIRSLGHKVSLGELCKGVCLCGS